MNAEAMIENAGEDERPIIFEELAFVRSVAHFLGFADDFYPHFVLFFAIDNVVQLPSLGISGDSISFTAISMESDKRICVQEQVRPSLPRRAFYHSISLSHKS